MKKENVIEKYEMYIKDYKPTWVSRFTWRDKNKDPKHTTSIIEFFKDTMVLDELEVVNTIPELFAQFNVLAGKYVDWVHHKKVGIYTEIELKDMHNFFNGAIGEFFVVTLLTEVKCLMKYIDKTKEIKRFDFNYVAPLLIGDYDTGVDITCVSNDKPSVIQVKWWNPFSKGDVYKPDDNVFHKLIAVGFTQYCRPEDKENLFLFWTGEEKTTTRTINKLRYEDWCVDFGNFSWGLNINGRNKIFWETFYKKLEELYK